MKAPYESLGNNLIGLAREFITDKDKAIEFEYKAKELERQWQTTLVTTKTIPWVDATIKLMYASVAFWRPAVSAFALVWGMVFPEKIMALHEMGPAGDAAIVSIYGSFPGWMMSRHKEKEKKAELEAQMQPRNPPRSWEYND